MSHEHPQNNVSNNNKEESNSANGKKSQNETEHYSIHIKIPAEQYTILLRKSNMDNISIDDMITNTIKRLLQ